MTDNSIRVILIGGTSHTGKSTLARMLASQLEWRHISTDTLARHPGRPWKEPPERVPEHVAEHYLTLSVDELIVDVLRHYKDNVWPKVEQLVDSHVNDHTKDPLVLEGSALWPEWFIALDPENIAGLWLTAAQPVIAARIYAESSYRIKNPRGKEMIDQFLRRSWAYNTRMMAVVGRLGLPFLDAGAACSVEQLCEQCLDLLAMGPAFGVSNEPPNLSIIQGPRADLTLC
jgi:2-phosphoglycerate kinase